MEERIMKEFADPTLLRQPIVFFPRFEMVSDLVHKSKILVYPTNFVGLVECQPEKDMLFALLKDDCIPEKLGTVTIGIPEKYSWQAKDKTSISCNALPIEDSRILIMAYWIGNENWVKIWSITKQDDVLIMETVETLLGNVFEELVQSNVMSSILYDNKTFVRDILSECSQHINIRSEKNIKNSLDSLWGYVEECLILADFEANIIEFMSLEFNPFPSKIIHASSDIKEGNLIFETICVEGKLMTTIYRVRWSSGTQIAITPIAETSGKTVPEFLPLLSKYNCIVELSVQRFMERIPTNSKLY
jgi:hypothetical protein